jgi:hypothetical protein
MQTDMGQLDEQAKRMAAHYLKHGIEAEHAVLQRLAEENPTLYQAVRSELIDRIPSEYQRRADSAMKKQQRKTWLELAVLSTVTAALLLLTYVTIWYLRL